MLRALRRAPAVHRVVAALAQQVDLAFGEPAARLRRAAVGILSELVQLGLVQGCGIAGACGWNAFARRLCHQAKNSGRAPRATVTARPRVGTRRTPTASRRTPRRGWPRRRGPRA